MMIWFQIQLFLWWQKNLIFGILKLCILTQVDLTIWPVIKNGWLTSMIIRSARSNSQTTKHCVLKEWEMWWLKGKMVNMKSNLLNMRHLLEKCFTMHTQNDYLEVLDSNQRKILRIPLAPIRSFRFKLMLLKISVCI